MNRTIAWAALLACAAGPGPRAQDASRPEGPRAEFDRDIRPIFAGHCIACHGGIRQKGGVSLRSRKADRKSTRLNSSHIQKSRMPSSA